MPQVSAKNIFAIARRNSADDEDQLTELLAWLVQQEPRIALALLRDMGVEASDCSVTTQRRVKDGRLDLELEAPGYASVVIESKLGATTSYRQCKKYIEHLASSSAPERKLVLLTKLHEDWPPKIPKLAAQHRVSLVRHRWWDVTSVLRRSGFDLAIDFASMLENEGLVVPGRLTEEDWSNSSEIPPAVVALLTELKPRLSTLSRDFRRGLIARGRSKSYRSIYCLSKFDRVWIGIGFAASWVDLVKHRQVLADTVSIRGSVISCSIVDPRFNEQEQRTTARELAAAGNSDGSCWGKFPILATSARSVLTARTFHGQVDQAFDYARSTVEQFREVGYLTDLS